MGLPNPSRETKFSGANADREIILIIFPLQLTTNKQDWQLYPVDPSSCYNMCNHTIHTPASSAEVMSSILLVNPEFVFFFRYRKA